MDKLDLRGLEEKIAARRKAQVRGVYKRDQELALAIVEFGQIQGQKERFGYWMGKITRFGYDTVNQAFLEVKRRGKGLGYLIRILHPKSVDK